MICPHCTKSIPFGATKCPECTGEHGLLGAWLFNLISYLGAVLFIALLIWIVA